MIKKILLQLSTVVYIVMNMKALKDSFGSADQLPHATINQADDQLWVDKYSPNSFKELLSDERTNREVNRLPINFIFLAQTESIFFTSSHTYIESYFH